MASQTCLLCRMSCHAVHFFATVIFILSPSVLQASSGCCQGTLGNVDQSSTEEIELLDLIVLVDNLFLSFTPLVCPEEANFDQSPDGAVDIIDLTMMVDIMFISFSNPPNCTNIPDFMPDVIRLRVMHSAESVFSALDWTNLDSANLNMRAYLRSVPEIIAADTMGGAVWANYTDSVMHIFSRNFDVGTTPIIPPSPPQTVRKAISREPVDPSKLSSVGDFELPSSTSVRLIKTVGDWFPGIEGELQGWFTSQGYTVRRTSGSVEDFKTIVGDGFFCFHGHGAAGRSPDGTTHYALWTSTPSDGNNPPSARAADLRAQRLVIYTARNDRDPLTNTAINNTNYGITGKFVTAYWGDFADHSMVWINACSGGGPLGSTFAEAVLARNAGLYFGWTQPVGSNNALFVTELMVDGMLGMNVAGTPANPPNRPFDYLNCYEYLVSKNQHHQPNETGFSEFVSFVGTGKAGILRPSIEVINLLSSEDFDHHLTGQFGSAPTTDGELIVGGQAAAISFWHPELMRFDIPKDGSGSAGDVVLKIPNPSGGGFRTSNVVPITRWTIPFTYTHTEAGAKLDFTFDFSMRADIHPFRTALHGETFDMILNQVNTLQESHFSFSASGSIEQSPQPGITVQNFWSGGCNMLAGNTTSPASYSASVNHLDLIRRELEIGLGAELECGNVLFRQIVEGTSTDITYPFAWILDPELGNEPNTSYTFQIDDTYKLSGGSKTVADPIQRFAIVITPIAIQSTLSWPTVTPEFPPVDTTAARIRPSGPAPGFLRYH